VAGLPALPEVSTYTLWPAGHDRVGVVSFNVEGFVHGELAAILSAEHGIGARAGAFCAHPLVDRLTGSRPSGAGAVRVSLGVGSPAAHVDRLLDALGQIVTSGPAWTYHGAGGRFVAHPDPRPQPRFEHLTFSR
jgi:selenocysteine lyase/cysteine desulfurase